MNKAKCATYILHYINNLPVIIWIKNDLNPMIWSTEPDSSHETLLSQLQGGQYK